MNIVQGTPPFLVVLFTVCGACPSIFRWSVRQVGLMSSRVWHMAMSLSAVPQLQMLVKTYGSYGQAINFSNCVFVCFYFLTYYHNKWVLKSFEVCNFVTKSYPLPLTKVTRYLQRTSIQALTLVPRQSYCHSTVEGGWPWLIYRWPLARSHSTSSKDSNTSLASKCSLEHQH